MGSQTASDPRIGSVLQGRYRIIEKIATGAMGSIYRAERLKLGRPVAIKFLEVSFAAEADELLQRFEREARAMSRLGHPHCVSVIDFGVAGAPYIVMEYVTGTTLEQIIGNWGALPPQRAVTIIRQVLAGLAHAHRQEIIHRDIKPANIMLTEATGTGDHARILDFGLAKMVDVADLDISTSRVVLGTPSYMPPEQSLGQPVDARSDLYSVAVVAFELLTGKKPFSDPDKLETLRKHQEEPPPRLADAAPEGEFSEELEQVIARALAKRPEDRYADAIEMSSELERVPEAEGAARFHFEAAAPDRTTPIERTSSRAPLLLVALVIVVVAAVTAWQMWLRPRRAGSSRAADSAQSGPTRPARSSASGGPGAGGQGDRAEAVPPGLDAGPADAGAAGDGGLGDGGLGDGGLGDGGPGDGGPGDGGPGDGGPGDDGATALGPVESLEDARALVAAGHRDEAIAGLRKLARRHPKSAAIPYLLGDLYLQKHWTVPAMEAYKSALDNNKAYRHNSSLIRKIIDALESSTASKQAASLLRHTIGKSALPQLEKAASHHRSRTVRKRAARLVRQISGKSGKKKR